MNTEVNAAIGAEEKPLIENIISMFQQLLAMQGGQADPVVEESEGKQNEEMEEVDVSKSSDGETGDDDAEKRLEEVTPTTDQSLQDLKKSIDNLITVVAPKKVQKSVPQAQNKDKTVQALAQISTVLKGIVESQNAQEQFNQNIMSAIGFTEDVVKKSLPRNDKVKKDKPVQTLDSAALGEVLVNAFKSAMSEQPNPEAKHPFNQKRNVRKDLRSVAQYIHDNAGRRAQ